MTKFSNKERHQVYVMLANDIGPKNYSKLMGIKEGAACIRMTRLKVKNGYKTTNKFFYELGRHDANLGK